MENYKPEFILCTLCGAGTCVPPEELIEYSGRCVSCVIQTEVLPLIRTHKSEALAGLVETILETAKDKVDLEDMVPPGGMAIVVGTGGKLSPDHVKQVIQGLSAALQQDPQMREAMKGLINELEQNPKRTETGVPYEKIVHNDPRWG